MSQRVTRFQDHKAWLCGNKQINLRQCFSTGRSANKNGSKDTPTRSKRNPDGNDSVLITDLLSLMHNKMLVLIHKQPRSTFHT